jgi:hypothetical protein
MTKPELIKPEDYLELFKISDYKYIIGVFESGQTFYKQQIRALNIFDALKKTGKIPEEKDFTVAIIGGGIAGLTFAAASLKSGFEVILFEQGSQTLNIQAGCTTRDIHPYLYDWPSAFSTQTRTDLPVLNWHHDTAGNVVKSIKNEFAKIVMSADAIRQASYQEYCSVKELNVNERTSGKKFELTGKTESRYGGDNIHHYADIVIYAIGYGVEKGISGGNKSESYWRDTSVKQDDLSKCNYIIQGTGDGALIDLFSILIRDFSYESFLEILHANEAGKRLFERLVNIRDKRINSEVKLPDDFYEAEFSKIPKSEFQYIFDAYDSKKMFAKLDASVNVYLFGKKKTFHEILHYNSISFINAFIASILFRYQKFLYASDLHIKNPKYDGKTIPKNRKIIRRIGTDKKAVISKVGFTLVEKRRISTIAKKQNTSAIHGIVRPQWEDDAFNKYFGERGHLHHLSKKTKSLCSVFTDILGGSLEDFYQGREKNQYKKKEVNNKVLRVTMHRVLSIDGDLKYQMLTPYAPLIKGPKREDHKVGTIYNIDKGNVAYTIRTGAPLWVKNTNQDEFDKLMKDLNVVKRYDKKYSPKAILTIPIIAKYHGAKSSKVEPFDSTNAVIYIDSSEVDFFDDPNVRNMILRHTATFVNTLNLSLSSDDIQMALVDFEPPKIQSFKLSNPCIVNLKPFKELSKYELEFELTLINYSSFEMLPWN